jgi:hypothetical protein
MRVNAAEPMLGWLAICLNLLERLIQVRENVVDLFEAD